MKFLSLVSVIILRHDNETHRMRNIIPHKRFPSLEIRSTNAARCEMFLYRWAAYVAGTILVLMREIGVRFNDSMSILVRF